MMFDLGIFMFKTNRGMTPQSANNMFNNISDIDHYQTRAPCRMITLESLSINRLQKLHFLQWAKTLE